MSNRRTRSLINHFKNAIKNEEPYFKIAMDPEDCSIWYILLNNISGPNNEFISGEYLFTLDFPKEYPDKPPVFRFKTPNGFYEPDVSCCIHIGAFHSQNYPITAKARGFIIEIANGLMCYNDMTPGIGLINTTVNEKKQLAILSKMWNKKYYSKIIELINTQYIEYSKTWKKTDEEQMVEALNGIIKEIEVEKK